MNLRSLPFFPKSFVGVDIGTAALKVVELSRWGTRVSLKNYGEMESQVLYQKPFRTAEKSSLLLSSKDIARALQAILQDAKIETKETIFSIPDFSSFFTHFELPPMTKEELSEAVQYEARKHVPLPFSEITFDWQVINHKRFNFKNDEPVQILLVAVPNELINQYQEIANLSGLKLVALEAEVFGLIRSSLKGERSSVALLDIGAQTTTINIVSHGTLRTSHSIDTGGGSFTERIAQSLSIPREKAEQQKRQQGLEDPQLLRILSPLLDTIGAEIVRVTEEFARKERREIQKIVLGGGSALLPGLPQYFAESLRKETEIIDPWRSIFYPPLLESTMKQMGPSYAVAVGAALRGVE